MQNNSKKVTGELVRGVNNQDTFDTYLMVYVQAFLLLNSAANNNYQYNF